jgi:hypothetical protein
MAIKFTKYIDITSGVGGAESVTERELIGRLFTANTLLPSNSIIEFTDKDEVGAYFGTTSTEYKRASFYFDRISKSITKAKKISFARWVDADTAAMIFGKKLTATLATFTAIADASFTLTIGAVSNNIGPIDFTGAVSLAAVATLIQTAIRTETGLQWTAATVTYDNTRGGFNLVTGDDSVNALISVSAGTTGTNIATTMGWFPEAINGIGGAIWSDGQTEQTITDILTDSTAISDNFGSFLFMPSLTLDQVTEAAIWNDGENVKFMYCIPVPDLATAQTYEAALIDYAGSGLTVTPADVTNEYPEMCPMTLMAETDYTQPNATINYMFQEFALTPSVTDTTTSDQYDAIRVNYYGQTQTAGRTRSFYQRGKLMGGSTAPVDMNTYANEVWLKDSSGVSLMNLLLAVEKIPANLQGVGQVLTILQGVIDRALSNGVISVGGVLNDTQKAYITQITQDPKAWYKVQNVGYWVNCTIVTQTDQTSAIEYVIKYTIVYKKDDVIRKVIGTDILI